MAYFFYMDKMLCPVAPSELELQIKGQNKTLTLINEGEINILKKAGLTEISFDMLLPNVKYPFATYKSGFQNAKFFLDELERMKMDNEPFQFIVTRTFPNGKMLFDTNMKVSLEDYTIREDREQGFDVVVSVKLKQYKDFGTKTCKITFASTKPKASTKTKRPASKNSPAPKKNTKSKSKSKTHKVKSGDCLWNIAKKYYGDGSQWKKIYNANKSVIEKAAKKHGFKSSSNGHWIFPGTKLTIPG